MLILKAAALAIVVCVLVLCLKKDQPGFAFLLSLCGAAGLLWFAVQQLRPLLARLQQLAGQAGGDSFSILLQVLAIAFVAQLAADFARSRPCCRRVLYGIRGPHFGYAAGIASAAKLAGLVFVLFIVIAFPLPAAAAELPAGVQQILQQSELTPDKLVHITLQELLQTLAGWLKNAWGQPLQLARRAVLFLLLSSCVGLLADGGAWRDCVDLVAVLGFGTIALNK